MDNSVINPLIPINKVKEIQDIDQKENEFFKDFIEQTIQFTLSDYSSKSISNEKFGSIEKEQIVNDVTILMNSEIFIQKHDNNSDHIKKLKNTCLECLPELVNGFADKIKVYSEEFINNKGELIKEYLNYVKKSPQDVFDTQDINTFNASTEKQKNILIEESFYETYVEGFKDPDNQKNAYKKLALNMASQKLYNEVEGKTHTDLKTLKFKQDSKSEKQTIYSRVASTFKNAGSTFYKTLMEYHKASVSVLSMINELGKIQHNMGKVFSRKTSKSKHSKPQSSKQR